MLRLAPGVLLLVLAACGRTAGLMAGDDGGTGGHAEGGSGGDAGGGSGGGTAGGSGGGTDAGVVACAGLDEATCRHTQGCVADTCFACSCTEAFARCRAATAPEYVCPGLGCASPICCHTEADCGGGQFCAPPGTPRACGTCRVDGNCSADADCAPGSMCRPDGCACSGASCVTGCTSDAECADGEVCDVQRHCVRRSCASAADCPASFHCVAGSCARRTCTSSDTECDPAGGSWCVDGACYAGLGECRLPVP